MRKIFICIICCSCLITVNVFAASRATYGPIAANDTLWHIANELKPNNQVSVDQVMLAIFCYNEDAFSSSNINALKVGEIVRIPSIDRISSIQKDKAYREVEKQNIQWKKAHFKQPIKHHKPHKILKHKKKAKRTNPEQTELLPQQPIVEIPKAPAVQQPSVVTMPPPQPPAPSPQEIAFIAETNNRLEAINANNTAMHAQVIQLNEKMSYLEQNLEQLKKYILESQKTFWDNLKPLQQYAVKLATHLGQPLFTILFVCIVILLLLILFYLLFRHRKDSVLTTAPRRDIVFAKEEYNLMESKEGVAAKLNLARAYTDMGKITEARIMLDEVLENGSLSEQAEAKELLAKIGKS
jgi:FimV-like protein